MKWTIWKYFEMKNSHERPAFSREKSVVLVISLYLNTKYTVTVSYLHFINIKYLLCLFKKIFLGKNMAFGKMVTESMTIVYHWVKKYLKVIKRADSVTLSANRLWTVKQSSRSLIIGNFLHRLCNGVPMGCTFLRENCLFVCW